MISLTGEYALRAMVYLAKNSQDWPISGPRIAEGANIPSKYLSSILADLVRAGLLTGTRGKSGGFQITQPDAQIPLVNILRPFEPVNFFRQTCPFGNAVCSDSDPCGAHERWKGVRAAFELFLAETTLEGVASKKKSKSLAS